MAQGFWSLLIPHGLQGGALSHIASTRQDGDGDDRMGGAEEGWQDKHTQWWFRFLEERKLKGVSKDVWQMVRISQ
jgi:DCN1-like protein 1/2